MAFHSSGYVAKENTKLINRTKINGSCGCCAHLGTRPAFIHTTFPSVKLIRKAQLYRRHMDWPWRAQQMSVRPGQAAPERLQRNVSTAFCRGGSTFWVWFFQTPSGDFSKGFLWAQIFSSGGRVWSCYKEGMAMTKEMIKGKKNQKRLF